MDVAKQHDIAEQRRNSGDLPFQKHPDLAQTELAFRIGALPNHFEPNVGFRGFVQVDESHISLVADAHQALVFHDAAQPCAEGPFPSVLFQTLECLPEGVLNLIFGIAAITDHQAGPFQTSVAVALDQFAESQAIPSPGAFD